MNAAVHLCRQRMSARPVSGSYIRARAATRLDCAKLGHSQLKMRRFHEADAVLSLGHSKMTAHITPFPAAPRSTTISRHGWAWSSVQSIDENFLDLAFLAGRSSTSIMHVGCAIVSGVQDGSMVTASEQGEVLVCGVNSWLFKPGPSDCHAEVSHTTSNMRFNHVAVFP